jgi:hypothetical protein
MKKYTNKIIVIAGISLFALTVLLVFIEWKNGKWERIDTKTEYNNPVEADDVGNEEVVGEGIEE